MQVKICRQLDQFTKTICVSGLALVIAGLIIDSSSVNAQVIGFTEPFKKIELSSDEAGAIATLHIEEGDAVAAGDTLAQLDSRVQTLQLEIATKLASTKSHLIGAKKTLEKRRAILKRLTELNAKGHASASEIIRAEMELSIAEAKWLGAQEDLAVRELEKKRAEVQLARRSITAPFSGVVSKIHRRQGEFLSPIHPEVVTIIQVDQLIAKFNIPSSQISMFSVGSTFQLALANGESIPATVKQISVITDAESGTVEVKLVIDNVNQKVRSGESVTLNI
jgi:RND family efflux transporter MFP subunit